MIYIIEDDENIRNLVQVALNGSGYETAAFETAEEALGAFKVKAPQLAIFDLMLPYVAADVPVTRADVATLGEGGLCLGCPECHFPICPFGK